MLAGDFCMQEDTSTESTQENHPRQNQEAKEPKGRVQSEVRSSANRTKLQHQ